MDACSNLTGGGSVFFITRRGAGFVLGFLAGLEGPGVGGVAADTGSGAVSGSGSGVVAGSGAGMLAMPSLASRVARRSAY